MRKQIIIIIIKIKRNLADLEVCSAVDGVCHFHPIGEKTLAFL
jgi:hypothetical protein